MSKVEETEDKNETVYYNYQNRNRYTSIIKKKINMNYYKMSNLRIIQKKLVYVIGLSSAIAFREVKIKINYRTFYRNLNILVSMGK